MIFTSVVFTYARHAYNVVVLPDPVGPVQRMMPFGYFRCLKIIPLLLPSMPSSSNGGTLMDLSTIRITRHSHRTLGNVLARRSISLFVKVTLDTLASCGTLFSSGLICPDSILNFEMMLSWRFLGYWTSSCRMPSILILILQ